MGHIGSRQFTWAPTSFWVVCNGEFKIVHSCVIIVHQLRRLQGPFLIVQLPRPESEKPFTGSFHTLHILLLEALYSLWEWYGGLMGDYSPVNYPVQALKSGQAKRKMKDVFW